MHDPLATAVARCIGVIGRPTVVRPGERVPLHVKAVTHRPFLSRAGAIEHGREITAANFHA